MLLLLEDRRTKTINQNNLVKLQITVIIIIITVAIVMFSYYDLSY
jgi:hypothetical protein